MNTKISITHCKTYQPELVQAGVRLAIDLLGGITHFVKPESKVLVKPNLLTFATPESCVDTHPEVVRAIVKILKEIRCEVFIGDGPSAFSATQQNIDKVFEDAGMKAIAEEEGVALVKFEKHRHRGKLSLTTWLDTCEYLISVPKFKTHELTTLTAAVKNNYGLLSATQKIEFHKNNPLATDFSRVLIDIYEQARPALTVVDGVVAMEGDGPASAGTLRNVGLILAGKDCIALDSALACIMGLTPLDIPTNKEGAMRGAGVADIDKIEILGVPLEEATSTPFKLPASTLRSKVSRLTFVTLLMRKLIRFLPEVDHAKCIKCGACVAACPNKIIRFKNNKITIQYAKCISCFCCQESCPSAAISIKKSFFARTLGF